MRGNPIKEWIVFSTLWLLLLIPVIRLTTFRKSTEVAPNPHNETTAATSTKATAILRYTEAPLFIKVIQNDRTICNLHNPSPDETEQDLSIIIDDQTTEFLLQAKWPDEKKHVFEIEMIVEGKEEQTKHFWAERELDEAVSFHW